MKDKKFNTGIWTKEDINYLRFNVGKYPLTFIAKKLNRTMNAIFQRLVKLNLKVENCMVGHDFLSEKEFAIELGLSRSTVKTLRKNKIIKYKHLGRFIGIPFSELDKMEELLSNWIDPKTCCRILKIPKSTFTTRLLEDNYYKNLERIKIGNCYYYKKNDIQKIRDLITNSYSVKEFAKLSFYDFSSIENFREQNKIEFFYLSGYRIPKKELEKILNIKNKQT